MHILKFVTYILTLCLFTHITEGGKERGYGCPRAGMRLDGNGAMIIEDVEVFDKHCVFCDPKKLVDDLRYCRCIGSYKARGDEGVCVECLAADGSISTSSEPESDTDGDVETVECSNTSCIEKFVKDVNERLKAGTVSTISEIIATIRQLNLPICLEINNANHFVSFDNETQLCCNGVQNKTSKHQICCDGQVVEEQLCCNDKVLEKDGADGCCGNKMFDTREEICCNDTVSKNVEQLACCGDQLYNKTTDLCCNKTLLKEESDDSRQNRDGLNSASCCNGQVSENTNDRACCNGEVYVRRCFHCSNDTVLLMLYGPNEEHCTNSTVLENLEEDHQSDTDGTSVNEKITSVKIDTEYPRTKAIKLSYSEVTAICIGAAAGILIVSFAAANKRLICDLDRKVRKLCIKHGYQEASNAARSNTQFIDEENILTEANAQDTNGDEDDMLAETTPLTDNNICTTKFEGSETSNLITSLFRQTGSQTSETHCHPKQTIFGKPFELTSFPDRSNNVVQGPHSDVRMTVPVSVVKKETLEVKWTTFSDIPALNEKLGLGPCERLASPVVEYSVKGHKSFPEHACIIMPFLGPPDDISVCYFKSDEGLNQTVKTINIPRQTKENSDLDVFYVIQDNKLLIYTRHCSGYFCKKKHCREMIGFRGLVYGSFRKVNREHSVAVSFYVADELFIFKDYEQRLRTDEIESKKRTALDNFSITLSTDLHHNDYFETGIVVFDTALWTHRIRPDRNEPIYPYKQKLRLEELVKQCTECRQLVPQVNEYPKRFDWSLNTIAQQTPNDVFRFIIDMWTSTESGELKERLNSKEIDCLELRHQDRLPKEEVQGAMMHPNCTEPDQGQWPLGAVGGIGARECPAPELSNPCHSSQPSEIHN